MSKMNRREIEFANLSKDKLEKLKKIEDEMGVVLIAYNKDKR